VPQQQPGKVVGPLSRRGKGTIHTLYRFQTVAHCRPKVSHSPRDLRSGVSGTLCHTAGAKNVLITLHSFFFPLRHTLNPTTKPASKRAKVPGSGTGETASEETGEAITGEALYEGSKISVPPAPTVRL